MLMYLAEWEHEKEEAQQYHLDSLRKRITRILSTN